MGGLRSIKEYVVECCAEAPLAWRRGQIVSAALGHLAVFVLLYLGWHFDAYPTSYFLIATAVIAFADVVLIFPYKLWKANKTEISRLKGEIDSNRTRLWELREAGVKLRNEGKRTRLPSKWAPQFEEWHSQVIEAAGALSVDLRYAVKTLDKIAPESNEPVAVPDEFHQKNVSVMSEILSRIYKFLNESRK